MLHFFRQAKSNSLSFLVKGDGFRQGGGVLFAVYDLLVAQLVLVIFFGDEVYRGLHATVDHEGDHASEGHEYE
jgi:hypothetical protein